MSEPSRRDAATHRRDQAGVTLIELLAAVAVTAILIVPLAAWTITTVRGQGAAGQHLSNAVATGRVSSIFGADVVSARSVATSGADCTGGPGSGGVVKLSILTAGATSTRIVYTEALPAGQPAGSPERSLWRRQCTPTGTVASSSELFPEIRPGSVVARCPLPAPPPPALPPSTPPSNCLDATAKRVQLSVTPDGPGASPRAIVLNATRRADSGSVGVPGGGNRPPIAQIEVDALVGYVGLPFRFSGAGSEDLDGPLSPTAYHWEFPGPGGTTVAQTGVTVDHVFTELGEHTVLLEVRDAENAVNVAAITVRVVNRHPTAAAVITPETGEVGVTSFHFSATSSVEQDTGDALQYSWDLGPGPAGFVQVRSGPEIDVVFPEGTPTGRRQITLTVTDSRGGRDVLIVQIGLGGPPVDGGGILMNPEPIITSGTPVLGTVGPGRPDLAVDFILIEGDPAASTWRLTRVGGGEIATGPGSTLSHTFVTGDQGEYRIARVDGSGQQVGTDRLFRVNAGPVAAFTTTGGSTDSPRTVGFASTGSSDPDGSIVAWRWTFGFFGVWTSSAPTPTQVFTHPGRYQVRLEVIDDLGATSSIEQTVEVTGVIPTPAAPSWQGGQIVIGAVPGAEAYRLHVTCNGAPVVVPDSELPAVPTPTLVLPPGTCVAPAVAAATYELRAAGVWSPTSPAGVRP